MTDQLKAIRAEIERRMNKNKYSTAITEMVYAEEDENILSFIDTLQEEPSCPKPSDNLEETAEAYRRESIKTMMAPNIDGPLNEYCGNIKGSFIAGAKWQKQKMMKGAVVANVSIDEFSCGLYNLCVEAGLTSEDEVEIIIRKKDEPQNP